MARTPEPRYIDTDKASALLGDYPEAETDKKVFTCIAFACDRKGNAALSDYEIAEKTGLTEEQVKASVQRLIAKGILTMHPENQ